MDNIIAIAAQNWQYVIAAIVILGVAAVIVVTLFLRLKHDIRLNKKIERLSGRLSDQEAANILKRMSDTSTEDTLLKILPTLGTTRLALRRSGLPISLVAYIAMILLCAAAVSLTWNNPIIPEWLDFAEPLLEALVLHVAAEKIVLRFLVNRRKAALLNQLSSAIQHVSRSITAGQSADRAVSLAAAAALEPLKRELADVVRLNSVGVPLEQALRAASPAIDLAEFDFFVSALEASMQSGGNLARVLDELVGVIRARRQLKMKVDALTAEGKMSALLLSMLPIGLLGWLDFSQPGYIDNKGVYHPGYLDPLFYTSIGQVMLYGGFVLIGVGLVIMLRMVSFKA